MHLRESSFDYESISDLSDLKKEYIDLMNVAQILQKHRNVAEAAKMEEKARLIASEIIKLDPDFVKKLDSDVTDKFKDEAEVFNRLQHEKPDHKEMN